MIDEFITKIGLAIRDALGSVFNLNWIPEIWFWYWWLFVLFLFTGAVIWFFGWSKIVRMVASIGFLFAAVFVAGGAVMAKRLKEREEGRRPTPKPADPPQSNDRWLWPWEKRDD